MRDSSSAVKPDQLVRKGMLEAIRATLLALAVVLAFTTRDALAPPAHPPAPPVAVEIQARHPKPGLQVRELNTFAFACDGVNHQMQALESGARLRKLTVWFGTYGYTNADIIFTFERVSKARGWQSIAKAGWDHYAEPTGAAGQLLTFDFAPDWIEIQPDETLELYYQCNPMNDESKSKKAHLIAFLYYWGEEK